MDKEQIETLVQSYVKSYNRFDIAGMLKSIHPEICFKNISGDAVTASANGVHAFEALAEKAAAVFQERSQTIRSIDIQGRTARVGIDYRGILAADLSDDLKKGDTLALTGWSEFEFKEGKIISLTDYS